MVISFATREPGFILRAQIWAANFALCPEPHATGNLPGFLFSLCAMRFAPCAMWFLLKFRGSNNVPFFV